MTLTYLFTSKK